MTSSDSDQPSKPTSDASSAPNSHPGNEAREGLEREAGGDHSMENPTLESPKAADSEISVNEDQPEVIDYDSFGKPVSPLGADCDQLNTHTRHKFDDLGRLSESITEEPYTDLR